RAAVGYGAVGWPSGCRGSRSPRRGDGSAAGATPGGRMIAGMWGRWSRAAAGVVAVAVVVAATGCGGDESAEQGAADDGRLRVALLTAGPVSDAGWYAGAYE